MNLLIDSLPYTKEPMTSLQRLAEVCRRELKKIEYEEYVTAKVKQWEERKLAQAAVNEVNRNDEVSRMTSVSFYQPADNPTGQTLHFIGDQEHHQAAVIDENGNEKASHMMYAVFCQPVHSANGQIPLVAHADGPVPGPAVVQPPPEASPFKTPTGRGSARARAPRQSLVHAQGTAAEARGRGGAKRARLANALPGPRHSHCGGAARTKAQGRSKAITNAPDAPKANAHTHEGGSFIDANVCAHYYTAANGQVDAQACSVAPIAAHDDVGANAKVFCSAPDGSGQAVAAAAGARPWHVVLQHEGGARGFECALCGRAFALAPLLALHLRAQHNVEGVVQAAPLPLPLPLPLPTPTPTPMPLPLPLPTPASALPADTR